MINLLRCLKRFLNDIIIQFKFYCQLWRVSSSSPRLFYMMSLGPRFPNLGDQAQAAAIPIWLKKHFAMPVVQVKNDQIRQCLPIVKSHIKQGDLVFLHSGGNFGDDWYHTQLDREFIVSSLNCTPIIQLPQTIFYSDSESGNSALMVSQDVIQQHPAMLIFARDLQSHQVANTIFPKVKTYARPDMVLSLQMMVKRDLASSHLPKKGEGRRVLLIMRNDKEGIYDATLKQQVISSLEDEGYQTTLWDTDVDDVFPEHTKYEVLLTYLRFINSFDAVVTDRYHGLIFSVLVERPCVVLKTHNHKLTSAFDWFQEVNFVQKVDKLTEVGQALKALLALPHYISPDWNEKHFDPMAMEVRQFLESLKQHSDI
jgi:exopolysaccharide biosynthesis predicted pyruvyltransferase EpsI